jgi:RNA polymerase sigma-70 factor (ECF subfamily)
MTDPARPSASSDRTLVEAAVRGDREAARAVLRLVAPTVLATVRRIIGKHHPDVDDTVQEALLAIVRALPTFRGESSLVHFANRIATRRGIDCVRALVRSRRLTTSSLDREESEQSPMLRERRRQQWRELLGQLPIAQAEALALRAVEGYSFEEISEMTRVPLDTVRSRVRLAKTALRERIERTPALADLVNGEDS